MGIVTATTSGRDHRTAKRFEDGVVKVKGKRQVKIPFPNNTDVPMIVRAGTLCAHYEPWDDSPTMPEDAPEPSASINTMALDRPTLTTLGALSDNKPSITIAPTKKSKTQGALATDTRKLPLTQERKEWLLSALKLKDAPWLKGNPKALAKAEALVMEYHDIFSRHEEYGNTKLLEHAIRTHDVPPIKCKNRPINPLQQENLKKQIDTWLAQGVIEPSESPWGFALLAVPKKNGKTRWVIDYRRLNDITLKDSYPLPNIEDNLARLAHSRVFSALDGAGAYHVVSIRKEDREKTAFSSPFGLFQFKKMPFGLCNAPSTYSRLVQLVLNDMSPEVALPYLDDTLLHSNNVNQHLDIMRHYFNNTREAGLMLQPEKCSMFQKRVEYLGHEITEHGLQPLPDYVKLVTEWPEPATISELRTFLGKVSYYRKFIPEYAHKAAPLYHLLSNDAKEQGASDGTNVQLDEECRTSFHVLRQALTTAPILAYPDFWSDKPFILDTDWSKDPGAIGAVLSQEQDGEERVICYGARKLTNTEKNYPSNKGEILAVIHFMKIWAYYLKPRPFTLRTDHQAIKWIRTMEEPAGMIQRWLDILSNFQFTVQFRAGTKHGNADALSRIHHAREPNEIEKKESEEEALHALTYPAARNIEELVLHQDHDPILHMVRRWVTARQKPDLTALRHEAHELRLYAALYEVLYIDGQGVLRRKPKEGEYRSHSRICLPADLQRDRILQCHEEGGHMGVLVTQDRVAQRYYFPGLHKTVEMAIAGCNACQRKRTRGHDQRHTLISTQDGNPFQRLSLDFVGPFRPSNNGNKYILTVKDCFTRWVEAFPTKTTSAADVANILQKEIFCRYGFPEQIHTDQGTGFLADHLAELYQLLNIRRTHTPAYNPKSNPVERTHLDIHRILRAMSDRGLHDWETNLPEALFALRTARNRSTGVTPHFALFGREASMPIDHVYPQDNEKYPYRHNDNFEYIHRLRTAHAHMRQNVQVAVERARRGYNGKAKGTPINEGCFVWVYTPVVPLSRNRKHHCFWTGPWKVVEKLSPVLFIVHTEGRWNHREVTTTVTIDRIKPYLTIDEPCDPQDLNEEDFAIDDEFLEQGVADPDRLPHVRNYSTLPERAALPAPVVIYNTAPPEEPLGRRPRPLYELAPDPVRDEGLASPRSPAPSPAPASPRTPTPPLSRDPSLHDDDFGPDLAPPRNPSPPPRVPELEIPAPVALRPIQPDPDWELALQDDIDVEENDFQDDGGYGPLDDDDIEMEPVPLAVERAPRLELPPPAQPDAAARALPAPEPPPAMGNALARRLDYRDREPLDSPPSSPTVEFPPESPRGAPVQLPGPLYPALPPLDMEVEPYRPALPPPPMVQDEFHPPVQERALAVAARPRTPPPLLAPARIPAPGSPGWAELIKEPVRRATQELRRLHQHVKDDLAVTLPIRPPAASVPQLRPPNFVNRPRAPAAMSSGSQPLAIAYEARPVAPQLPDPTTRGRSPPPAAAAPPVEPTPAVPEIPGRSAEQPAGPAGAFGGARPKQPRAPLPVDGSSSHQPKLPAPAPSSTPKRREREHSTSSSGSPIDSGAEDNARTRAHDTGKVTKQRTRQDATWPRSQPPKARKAKKKR